MRGALTLLLLALDPPATHVGGAWVGPNFAALEIVVDDTTAWLRSARGM